MQVTSAIGASLVTSAAVVSRPVARTAPILFEETGEVEEKTETRESLHEVEELPPEHEVATQEKEKSKPKSKGGKKGLFGRNKDAPESS